MEKYVHIPNSQNKSVYRSVLKTGCLKFQQVNDSIEIYRVERCSNSNTNQEFLNIVVLFMFSFVKIKTTPNIKYSVVLCIRI